MAGHTHGDPDPGPEPVREREVIVTEGRSRGPGAMIGAIIGVVLVLLLAWVLVTQLGGEGDSLNVDVPDAEVNVDTGEDS